MKDGAKTRSWSWCCQIYVAQEVAQGLGFKLVALGQEENLAKNKDK